MAFSMNRPGSQGVAASYADLLASILAAQPSVTTLAGSGVTDTLTGVQIASGVFVRSGATAAVAATTDTAALILAALGANAYVGQTFLLFYVNNNSAAGAVTVTGGTGVTVVGTAIVPINNAVMFVGTVTGAAAITLNGAAMLSGQSLPGAQFTSISSGNGTLAAGAIEGAEFTVLATSGATAMTTRTAAQMIAQAGLSVGQSYMLRVYNTNGGTLTLTAGSGVTITGTATIATAVFRDYVVTVTAAGAITMQNVGSGVAA